MEVRVRERKLRHGSPNGTEPGTGPGEAGAEVASATATAGHRPHGDDVRALCGWLHTLDGGPTVTRTEPLNCTSTAHPDPAGWFFTEADPASGLARRRCLACGDVTHSLDSEARWTYPPMWSCPECGQSISELAAGLAVDEEGRVGWVALGARCVACGCLAGLTDFVVAGVPVADVLERL